MGTVTAINWTHHTWNPVTGCTKISDGCDHCYAATLSERNLPAVGKWGPEAPRVFSEAAWKHPARWNRAAEAAGEVRRVFVASLADVFEGEQHPVGAAHVEGAGGPRPDYLPMLARMVETFAPLTNLRVLVLTKRPWNMAAWAKVNGWPATWWAGTTVENQEQAEARIPFLLRVPAAVRFLSCEPLIGPVDLDRTRCPTCGDADGITHADIDATTAGQPWCPECDTEAGSAGWLDACADRQQSGINWVIGGGESGPHARPWNPAWARQLRDQCEAAGVPFLWKQNGEWAPFCDIQNPVDGQYPHSGEYDTIRVGKKSAGRHLDGVVHHAFPVEGE
jgi:protein gp37